MKIWVLAACLFLCAHQLQAQDTDSDATHAGYVPVITGGLGYLYNVNGGIPTIEPQINPLLLVPIGSHVLIESRTDFTGFFQRREGTTGDYTGEIFKTIEFAQVDWLADTHAVPVVGRYLMPYGLYAERLTPFWISNFQDTPIDYGFGTRTGDGGELRGVLLQNNLFSVQYATYLSAHFNNDQIGAKRATGVDGSVFFPSTRVEVGGSYQRSLESHQTNTEGAYVSWQPQQVPLDLKAEYDHSFNGNGYWIETGYMLSQVSAANSFFRNVQLVGRAQQFYKLNGGGSGVPNLDTQRLDLGINYYFRDDWRFISSYGRQFATGQDHNVWNVGFTYRFLWPLWPGRK